MRRMPMWAARGWKTGRSGRSQLREILRRDAKEDDTTVDILAVLVIFRRRLISLLGPAIPTGHSTTRNHRRSGNISRT